MADVLSLAGRGGACADCGAWRGQRDEGRRAERLLGVLRGRGWVNCV